MESGLLDDGENLCKYLGTMVKESMCWFCRFFPLCQLIGH